MAEDDIRDQERIDQLLAGLDFDIEALVASLPGTEEVERLLASLDDNLEELLASLQDREDLDRLLADIQQEQDARTLHQGTPKSTKVNLRRWAGLIILEKNGTLGR